MEQEKFFSVLLQVYKGFLRNFTAKSIFSAGNTREHQIPAMNSSNHSQMYRSIIASLILILTLSSCGKDNDVSRIDMELIEAKTELPAKVRLFFKADLGDEFIGTTLQPGDFEIYEDGSRISSLESQAQIQNDPGEFLFSSVLLLDLSGSVLNDNELPKVKEAAISFVESVMPETSSQDYGSKEMAVFWFDGEEEIHLLVPFTSNPTTLNDGINSITEGISSDNSTNLNGAVVQGMSVIQARVAETKNDPNISTAGSLVIFTDGTDQAGRVPASQANATVSAASNEYSVFTIGLGGEIDEDALNRFGRDGFELAENSFDLNSSFLAIANKLESQAGSFYVLEYCSPKRSGDHTIQLRAVYDDYAGSFTTEFNADDFLGGCVID